MTDDVCVRCGKPMEGVYVTDVGGFSHRWCYYRAHPPQVAMSVADMVFNSDDPQFARMVSAFYLDSHPQKNKMLDMFNKEQRAHWERLIQAPEDEDPTLA